MSAAPSTAPDEKSLDTSGKDNALWLVKIPQYVAERLDNADDGDVIGNLQITTKRVSGKPAEHQLSVQLSFNSEPEEFVMVELPSERQLIAFESKDDKFRIKGKITKNYNFNPRDSEAYRRSKRERLEAAASIKQTQKLEIEDIQPGLRSAMDVDFIPPAYVENRKAALLSGTGQKRSRTELDSRDIRSKILEAFDRTERLTLKELNSSCQASEKDLKDQLKLYATFHSKGPYRNYWELKSEYKGTGTKK
jgi:hypothetical protein